MVQWLLSGADEYKLASRLSDIQRVSMGMSVIDEELHRRVARRLLGLLADAELLNDLSSRESRGDGQ